MLLSLILSLTAHAASLDQLEVAGQWGTPTSTDATAIWWNPAGMAMESGTRVQFELAPTIANISYDRQDALNGGLTEYRLVAPSPYAGVVTDFGVKGLGIGLGLVVPFARGAAITSNSPTTSGRYSFTKAMIQNVHLVGGAAYSFADRISFGFTGQLALSQYGATIDAETLTTLNQEIQAQGKDPGYTDSLFEDPDYAARVTIGPTRDTAFTFSGGMMFAATETLDLSVTYVHGYKVQNTGPAQLDFSCPPQSDTLGRFGAESRGICDTSIQADATISYALPSRVQAGVHFKPSSGLHLQLMGGWVGWKVFDNYHIVISNPQGLSDDAKQLVAQDRLWARDNQSTFWGGLDVKQDIGDALTVGGRFMIDPSAVPDRALITNNFDLNTYIVGGMVAFRPNKKIEIGLNATQYIGQSRTITNSGFGVTFDEANKKDDAWYYPHGNGTYRANITRIGLQFKATLGQDKRVDGYFVDEVDGILHLEQSHAAATTDPQTALGEETSAVEEAMSSADEANTPNDRVAPSSESTMDEAASSADDAVPPESNSPEASEKGATPEVTETVDEGTPEVTQVFDLADTNDFPGRLKRIPAAEWKTTPISRYEVNPKLSSKQRSSVGHFLAPLWTVYGAPSQTSERGFRYAFEDSQTGVRFAAQVEGRGPEYLISEEHVDSPDVRKTIAAFEEWLTRVVPSDTDFKYQSDAGPMRSGATNGVFFDEPAQ